MSVGGKIQFPMVQDRWVDEQGKLTPEITNWLNTTVFNLNEFLRGGLDTQGASATHQKNISFLGVPEMTTTIRDSVVPSAAMIIFNTTTTKYQGHVGAGVWVDFH